MKNREQQIKLEEQHFKDQIRKLTEKHKKRLKEINEKSIYASIASKLRNKIQIKVYKTKHKDLLTTQELTDLFEQTDGHCQRTGIKLNIASMASPDAPYLILINPGSYVIGNVLLVSRLYSQCVKYAGDEGLLKMFCREVINHANKKAIDDLDQFATEYRELTEQDVDETDETDEIGYTYESESIDGIGDVAEKKSLTDLPGKSKM